MLNYIDLCLFFSVSEVFPLQMEGVRLVVNKGLSNHFQVSHTVTLSTLGESGYRFGSTYVGTKQTGPAEVMIIFTSLPQTPKMKLIFLALGCKSSCSWLKSKYSLVFFFSWLFAQ